MLLHWTLKKYFSNHSIFSPGSKRLWGWFDGSSYPSYGNCKIDDVFSVKNTGSLICLLDFHIHSALPFFCGHIKSEAMRYIVSSILP